MISPAGMHSVRNATGIVSCFSAGRNIPDGILESGEVKVESEEVIVER
jgi:hypothetical protein